MSDALIDGTAHTCLLPEPFRDKRGAKSPQKHAGVHMPPASASNFMGREGECHALGEWGAARQEEVVEERQKEEEEEEKDEKEVEGVRGGWRFNLLALLVRSTNTHASGGARRVRCNSFDAAATALKPVKNYKY